VIFHILSADAMLQLKAMDGKMDETSRGFITVQFSTAAPTQPASLAVTNARDDIVRRGLTDSLAADTDSKPMKVMDVAVGLDPMNTGFTMALESILSKLDVFVRIVDKGSQVRIHN
jgi:hypothetical protein